MSAPQAADYFGSGDEQQARWLALFCRVFGFRADGDNYVVPGDRESWIVSDAEHCYAVVRDQFTVGVYWGIDEPTAFWFEARGYVMTERDLRTLDVLDRLSGGALNQLAAEWRPYWLSARARVAD